MHNCAVYASGLLHQSIAPNAAAKPAVEALFVTECLLDAPGVSIPRAEPHLVIRFDSSTRQGLDLHAVGARQRAHRKILRGGQRVVMARLRLGTHEAIFGVPSSAIAESIVPLEDLWGDAAARLSERLARVGDLHDVATILQDAIVKRLAVSTLHEAHTRLALDAASRLGTARVNDVAEALGVSERNLRRVFRETIGMSPKEFARLTRFHLALHAARAKSHVDWASVAVAAGYYDQAHLIAEFREIAGATPRALLTELRGASSSEGSKAAALL